MDSINILFNLQRVPAELFIEQELSQLVHLSMIVVYGFILMLYQVQVLLSYLEQIRQLVEHTFGQYKLPQAECCNLLMQPVGLKSVQMERLSLQVFGIEFL